jgi:hypothetical protein
MGFVHGEEHAIAKVGVEAANDLIGVLCLESMLAEDLL